MTCQAARLARPICPHGMQDDEDVVLVADIGGTNCRFVLWRLDSETGNHESLFQKVCMLAGACTCTHEGLIVPLAMTTFEESNMQLTGKPW